MSATPRLTVNGYTDREETYALLLYSSPPPATMSGDSSAALLEQSRFLQRALALQPMPNTVISQLRFFLDWIQYSDTARPQVAAGPLVEQATQLIELLWHSHHYGHSGVGRAEGSVATFGSVLVQLDWLAPSLAIGYDLRREHRTSYTRRLSGATAPSTDNIVDLEFDPSLSGGPRDYSPLYLREVYVGALSNVDVMDDAKRVPVPPTRIEVRARNGDLLFVLAFDTRSDAATNFATHQQRLHLAVLFATKLLGYCSLLRVLCAALLSYAVTRRVTNVVPEEKRQTSAFAVVEQFLKKLKNSIIPLHLDLRSADVLRDALDKYKFDAELQQQLGLDLLLEIAEGGTLSVDAADPLRRIAEQRLLPRSVDLYQDTVVAGWRKLIAVATTIKLLKEPGPAATAQQIINATSFGIDDYTVNSAYAIISAADIAAKYPPELTTQPSADDERLLLHLQRQAELALKSLAKLFATILVGIFRQCNPQQFPEVTAIINLLGNRSLPSDDSGRLRLIALVYVIALLIDEEDSSLAGIGVPDTSLVVEALQRVGACLEEAVGGRGDNSLIQTKASLMPFVAALDSPTLWRKSLRSLDRSADSLPNRLRADVPEALGDLRSAVLTLSGVPRELSRRLRAYTFEAWRRALVVKATATAIKLAIELHDTLADVEKRQLETANRTVAAAELLLGWLRLAAERAGFNAAQLESFSLRPSRTAAEVVGKQPPLSNALEDSDAALEMPTGPLLRTQNALISVSLDAALLAIGARPTTSVGEVALGGNEARRIFAGVATMIDNGRLVSRALQRFYDAKLGAADAAAELEKLTQELRTEEQQSLQEQQARNRALLNNAVLAQLDAELASAQRIAEEPPEWPNYAELVRQTRAAIENVEQTLDAKEFATRAAALLRDLRAAAQSAAVFESQYDDLFLNHMRAIHHLAVAGYVMRAELILASWLDEKGEQRAALEEPLRSAEHVIAQRALLDLRGVLDRAQPPGPGPGAATPDWQQLQRYRAYVDALGDGLAIDFVPVPSPEQMERLRPFLRFTNDDAAKRDAWVTNLSRYNEFQRLYFSQVVRRDPLSPTVNPLQQTPEQFAIADVDANALFVRLGDDRNLVRESYVAVSSGPLTANTQRVLISIDQSYKRLSEILDPRNLPNPSVHSLDANAMQEDRVQFGVTYYTALLSIVSDVNELYDIANNLLAAQTLRVQPSVARLFDAFRVVQTDAVNLLRRYFGTNIELPEAARRALPWRPETNPMLRDELQRLLRSVNEI